MESEFNTKGTRIEYPYLPEGRELLQVPVDNEFIQAAKAFAKEYSLDETMPNASIIVREGEVVAAGANGSDFHKYNECERVKQNIPSGHGYELCEGCHPKNHGEQTALKSANENGIDVTGADLYMWGHWWCCKPCWDAMIAAGINDVYVAEGSHELFDKNHENNIVGQQFTDDYEKYE